MPAGKKYPGELSTAKIRDIFALGCYQKRLYHPFKTFIREIDVRWADPFPQKDNGPKIMLPFPVSTLTIAKQDGRPVLFVSKSFIERNCEHDSDIADLIFHEVFHHILRHLEPENAEREVPKHVEDLALDSIINAHLHAIGSAGFMVKYYPDQIPYSFLRAESKTFKSAENEKKTFASRILHFRVNGKLRKSSLAESECGSFYEKLYALKITRREAIDFFEALLAEEPPDLKLLGNHGQSGGLAASGAIRAAESTDAHSLPRSDEKNTGSDRKKWRSDEAVHAWVGSEHTHSSAHGKEAGGGVFDLNQMRLILEALGLKKADEKAKNNFALICRRITTLSLNPGKFRIGTTYSRRLPAKLNRRDLFSIERKKYIFDRGLHVSKEIWIFFDYSGSMDSYRRFMIDLAHSLKRNDYSVRVAVWADGVSEISLEQFLTGKIPDVGHGTHGEQVSRFLKESRIRQCVIVTDNYAGAIQTKIATRIFLALVKGAAEKGSFLDRERVPDLHVFPLEP